MNYLAHAVLSFQHSDILIGNMMGDFVKGKNYIHFPPAIQPGLHLHRFIDHTTDAHPLVHEAMQLFRPEFILSAGVFVDIFFDHFLANDIRYFTDESLKEFTSATYQNLQNHNHLFDEKMKMFFGYMQEYNWLYNYKHKEGIQKSIRGICKRHPRLGNAEHALQLFDLRYHKLQEIYTAFFPELEVIVKEKFYSF